MQALAKRAERPELKALVAEASKALARLDAGRLEELVACCQGLNRELPPASAAERERLVSEAREAQGEMAIFARVLEATRANLKVMNRLRELRDGRLEYRDDCTDLNYTDLDYRERCIGLPGARQAREGGDGDH